jgi:hypothetical protein
MVKTEDKTAITIGLTVIMATLAVYWGVLTCGFINLDDPLYITNNPLIRNPDRGTIGRIFTEAHLGAWLPLTYVSFALDYFFWGYNPTGYHLTNLLLHAANGALVVLLTDRLCRERLSAAMPTGQLRWAYPGMLLFAGLFFALHPLRVESVAWAAERKDVLNGLLTLGSVLAYIGYARRRGAATERQCLPLYLLALSLFLLSLLAKQVSVALPVILLLLDWYPLRRFSTGRPLPLLLEKIPFFAIALVITLMTVYFAAAEKMLISMGAMPFYVRVLVSGNAIFEYCRLTLFPVGISPYFVLPKPLPYSYLVKTVAVAVLSLLVLRTLTRRQAVTAVCFAFVILLSPMLAFVQSGDDIALAARYTYLPSLALAIGAAAGGVLLAARLKAAGQGLRSVLLLGGMGLFLAGCVTMTMRLVPVWKDTGSFWSRVIAIEPVGRAYGDRGVYYLINGRSAAAVDDFSAAIDIALQAGVKSVYNLYAFRGVGLSDIGRYEEAVADFDRAISLFPHQTYFQQRGVALKALGKLAAAEEDFRRAGANPPAIDWFERK